MGNSSSTASYGQSVPAVEQACRILICLARNSGKPMRLTSICKEIGIHNSKGYSILNTLSRFGLVQRNAVSKTYSLGPGLAYLGRRVLEALDVRVVVAPFLRELSIQTGETSVFGLLSAEQVFIIAKEEGSQLIAVDIGLGHRFHMTAGAHGKALVAAMPINERKRILSRKRLYFYGSPERFDLKRLLEELEEVTKLGFAEDRGELQHGINAVSAAVMGKEGMPIGCVILIGTYDESRIRDFGHLVADTARSISKELGFVQQ